MSNTYSQADVASHNKTDSLWIVVDGDVYDLTKFQDDHPGMLTGSSAAGLTVVVHVQ
jgi:cytochrome b involved in lipid metabolism